MQLVPVNQPFRVTSFLLNWPNFGIDIDFKRKTINIPATGDLNAEEVTTLITAIECAISVAIGRTIALQEDGITIAECPHNVNREGCDGTVGPWCGYCRAESA